MSEPDLKGRVRGARLAMYQEVILDAAEGVFAEHGYEAAKVQAVAAAAGISLATLYGVFAKKWDLYCAVHARRIRELMEHVYGQISPAPAEPPEPLAVLLGGIGAYIEFHMQRPTYLRMHLHDGIAWTNDRAMRSPEQRQAWVAGLALLVSTLGEAIRGGVVVDEDPELIARTAIAMHQVRLAAWVDGGMKESVEDVVRSTNAQFIRAFCVPDRVPELLQRHGVGWGLTGG